MARSVGVNHEQVIEAAARLADGRGLDQLTLASVAQEVGIRLPSLYNHVAGLPGLRRELALYGMRQFGACMGRAAIGKSGDAAIIALAQAMRRFAVERPGLYAATVQAPSPDDVELQQAAAEVIGVIVAVLEPYGLSGDDAIHVIRGLRSLIHGFATLEAAGGFGIPLNIDESFVRLLRAYLAGVRSSISQA